MNCPTVSVIVLVWNGLRYLPGCLQAVAEQHGPDFEIVAVDNGSTDGSAELIARQFPRVRLVRNQRNLGYAAGNNAGIRASCGDTLVFLNQDTLVQPGWLGDLTSPLEDRRVGVSGCKILDYSGKTLLHCGGYLEMPLLLGRHIGSGEPDEGQYDAPAEVEYVTGASIAVRREVLEHVGEWDEQFGLAYYEDVDLCWRARAAGLAVRYEPSAVVWHDESASTRRAPALSLYLHCRARMFFLMKHYPVDWILREFVPAERTRLEKVHHLELRADHRALLEARAVCGRIYAASQREELGVALDALRQVTIRRQQGDEVTATPAPPGWGEAELIMPMPPVLQDACHTPFERLPAIPRLDPMFPADPGTDGEAPPPKALPTPPAGAISPDGPQARRTEAVIRSIAPNCVLQEHQFKSRLPLIGGSIAAARRAMNSISTKWYVRPVIHQQTLYNTITFQAIQALYEQQQVLENAVSATLADTNECMNRLYERDSAKAHREAMRQWSTEIAQQFGALAERLERLTDELGRQSGRIDRVIRQLTATQYGLSYTWDVDSVVAQLVEQQAVLQKEVNELRARLGSSPDEDRRSSTNERP